LSKGLVKTVLESGLLRERDDEYHLHGSLPQGSDPEHVARLADRFKHALVQDAAHEILLRGKRRELHARIAAVLEETFPEIADQRPDLLRATSHRSGRVRTSG
jgi:predicted ATPase